MRSSGIRALGPASLVRLAWLTGVALFLLPVLVMVWQVRALRRTGLPWLAGDAVAESLARAAGISRRVTVLLHEDVEAPMTCGLWRPAILLPRDAPTWNEADLQRALLHELEHVRRFDWPAHILARATCALYWCHPLVWMAWRRFHLEAERSCDDAVAEQMDRNAYAEQLVLLAQRLSPGASRPALAMAGRGDLSHRVLAVLDERQARGRAGRVFTAAAAMVAAVMLAGISPLKAIDAPQASASAPSDERPAFQVASIRRNLSGPPGPSGNFRAIEPLSGGSFYARNVTVQMLILSVYGIREDQLVGGPEWVRADGFDIAAKADGDVPREQLYRMVRTLLEKRFGLVMTPEQRERDVYVLTVDRSDGRLGPDLRRADSDCEAQRAARRAAGELLITPQVQPSGPVPLSGRRHAGECTTIASLATGLQRTFGTTVIDKTGLSGRWDYVAFYGTRGLPLRPPPGFAGAALPPPTLNEDAPSIFEAFQEHLGLKLERQRGMVDVLVIQSIQQPTEN